MAPLDAVELHLEARDDGADGRVVGLALGLGEDGEEHRAVERAVLLGHLREARLPPPEHLDAELDESGEGRGARGEGREVSGKGARGERRQARVGQATGKGDLNIQSNGAVAWAVGRAVGGQWVGIT